jgi:hypothetical protein
VPLSSSTNAATERQHADYWPSLQNRGKPQLKAAAEAIGVYPEFVQEEFNPIFFRNAVFCMLSKSLVIFS